MTKPKLCAIIILVGIGLLSCGKSHHTTGTIPSPLPEALQGHWQWVRSAGGITGDSVMTPETEGYTKELVIRGDSFSVHINHLFDHKGILEHEMVESIFSHDTVPAIKFGSDQLPMIYELSTDTLSLSENCPDCFGHLYEREYLL
jgi:hypothetical protein